MSVQRAPEGADDHASSKLKGKKIRGSDGKELGKIHDFFIDAASGKIAHIVVSSGGVLGVGDKLRVVGPSEVKPSAGEDFTAGMSEAEFRAMPTIAKDDLEAGRISAHPGTQQDTSTSSNTASSHSTGQLVRASELADKSIRADDQEVGEIEHVLIDFQSGTATALVDVESDFAGEDGKYVVPFGKLEIRSDQTDTIASSLMRSDFTSGQASATASTTTASTPVAGVAGQPTGAMSSQSGRSDSSAGIASSTTPPSTTSPISSSSESTSSSTSLDLASSTSTTSPTSTSTSDVDSSTSSPGATSTSADLASTTGSSQSASGSSQSATGSSQSSATSRSAGLSSTDVASSSTPSSSSSSEFSSSTAGRSSSADSTSSVASSTPTSSTRSDQSTDTSTSSSSPSVAASGSTGSSTSGSSAQDATSTQQGSTSAADSQLASSSSSQGATGSSTTSRDTSRSPVIGDSANAGTSVATSTRDTDEQLSPTGLTSGEQNPGSAMAVRQALDGDPTVARANVQVTTKIVLQGTVDSEDAKKRVEELAKEAAGSAQIENQITVQQKE